MKTVTQSFTRSSLNTVTLTHMATPEELQKQLEQTKKDEEEKRKRIEDAIEARKHEEQYNDDQKEAAKAADEAESKIDNPEE